MYNIDSVWNEFRQRKICCILSAFFASRFHIELHWCRESIQIKNIKLTQTVKNAAETGIIYINGYFYPTNILKDIEGAINELYEMLTNIN